MTAAHYDREVAAGRAMLDAGNVDAAIRHVKSALQINPHGESAFRLQIDILSAKDRPAEALRICERRLETVPDCRQAHLHRIRFQAEMGRAGLAKTALQDVIALFPDDPMMVHDCHLMHDALLDRNRAVLRRVRELRQSGYWGVMDLDALEQAAHANAGHLATLGRLQQADLERGDIDAETLHAQSIVRFLQGRLITARRLAGQAERLNPLGAPHYQELRFHATVGLIPLFWPAMLFIALTGSLTSRFPWFIRIFTNYALALLALFALGGLVGIIEAMPVLPASVSGPLAVTVSLLNVVWAVYAIWALGSIGRWRASRSQSYTISKDY